MVKKKKLLLIMQISTNPSKLFTKKNVMIVGIDAKERYLFFTVALTLLSVTSFCRIFAHILFYIIICRIKLETLN